MNSASHRISSTILLLCHNLSPVYDSYLLLLCFYIERGSQCDYYFLSMKAIIVFILFLFFRPSSQLGILLFGFCSQRIDAMREAPPQMKGCPDPRQAEYPHEGPRSSDKGQQPSNQEESKPSRQSLWQRRPSFKMTKGRAAYGDDDCAEKPFETHASSSPSETDAFQLPRGARVMVWIALSGFVRASTPQHSLFPQAHAPCSSDVSVTTG